MKQLVLFALLALTSIAPAQHPDWPAIKRADPPAPSVVDTLPKGKLYVVLHNDAPAQLLVSPPGAVSIKEYKDAVTIDGDFVDGGEGTRDYKAKQIFLVKRVQPGSFELLKVPAGFAERRLLSDFVPTPMPPTPGPTPPTPGPTPVPDAPIPTAGLHVLIVFDSMKAQTYPAAQAGIFTSAPLHQYLDQNTPKEGMSHGWRIWPSDTNYDADENAKQWGDAMKRKRDSLPWIIVSNGKTGFEGPLPGNVDDTMALIKKYAP